MAREGVRYAQGQGISAANVRSRLVQPATIEIGRSIVSGQATGIQLLAGMILSDGDNHIQGNTSNGFVTGAANAAAPPATAARCYFLKCRLRMVRSRSTDRLAALTSRLRFLTGTATDSVSVRPSIIACRLVIVASTSCRLTRLSAGPRAPA
jgi:hypothetical protein